jgi:hypothetical protein
VRWSLPLLSLLAVGTLAEPAPRLEAKVKPVLYFPIKVGTKWVYQQGEHEWTQVVSEVDSGDGMTIVTVSELGIANKPVPQDRIGVSASGLFWIENIRFKLKPDSPSCFLNLTLASGESWTSSGSKTDPRKLREQEWIEVPAGRFKALPVEWEHVAGTGETVRDIFWYAPGIGLVKSQQATEEKPRVLKSFTPAKD